VPIWVSGTINKRVITRLARFGAGWIPWGDSAQDLVTSIGQMRDGVAATGRDPSDIGVVGYLTVARDDRGVVDTERTMAAVPGLVAAGVTDVLIAIPMSAERAEKTDQLRSLVTAFRAVVGRSDVS
jgi:alkanesulfonate monooxygenase SsuD/methylene tetrahydromethanopterin reductase-like flavin-dependent oxidoreductase (luciferase family)